MESKLPDKIGSFAEFWPYYVREHLHPVSRTLHVCGSLLALGTLIFLLREGLWIWAWAVIPLGYGFAWLGHFVFEKNKPATFRYPLYSLMGDGLMLIKTLTGRMGAEVARASQKGTIPD